MLFLCANSLLVLGQLETVTFLSSAVFFRTEGARLTASQVWGMVLPNRPRRFMLFDRARRKVWWRGHTQGSEASPATCWWGDLRQTVQPHTAPISLSVNGRKYGELR